MLAAATPAGTVTSEAFETLVGELLDALKKAPPLDGLLLALHGAMVAEDYPQADGEVVRRVRELVGPDFPVVVTHDYHGNVPEQLVKDAWGQAQHYLQAALAQAEEAQEPTYTADVLDSCARLFGALGDYEQAVAYSQRATELNRQFGRSIGAAETLCTSGWVQNQVGRAAEAFAHYHTALALTQQSNSGLAEGVAWLGLG